MLRTLCHRALKPAQTTDAVGSNRRSRPERLIEERGAFPRLSSLIFSGRQRQITLQFADPVSIQENTMDELLTGLVEKAGLSDEQAAQVVEFLKENAHKVPGWLSGTDVGQAIADKLPGGLGGLIGGD